MRFKRCFLYCLSWQTYVFWSWSTRTSLAKKYGTSSRDLYYLMHWISNVSLRPISWLSVWTTRKIRHGQSPCWPSLSFRISRQSQRIRAKDKTGAFSLSTTSTLRENGDYYSSRPFEFWPEFVRQYCARGKVVLQR
jgi:hypothetical protein